MNKALVTPSRITLLLLLVLVLIIRLVPGAGEVYATVLYPQISAVLSWVSSFVPFSLDEVVCLVGIGILIWQVVRAVRQRWGWWRGVLAVVEVLGWYYVWFQFGWGCNYYRADFYHRMDVTPAKAEQAAFMRFAHAYRDSLNLSWEVAQQEGTATSGDQTEARQAVIAEIKALYHQVPVQAGLCLPRDYHQPKQMLLNGLYSASGVLGFMGPWMGENLLNADLLPVQFPSVYAHELSHLLGITSEAEANYWAYYICTRATSATIRYSGYQGLLPYVLSNARTLLSEDEYRDYFYTIRPEVMDERRAIGQHWDELRQEWVDACQNFLLDMQLKGHGIPSGKANYNQVVQMIMSVDSFLQN